MARSKSLPAAALIVGILNLVLFVPCLCISGGSIAVESAGSLSGFGATAQQKEMQKKLEESIRMEVPNQKAVQLVTSVVEVLCSIGMIVSAIGIFMKQSWGRLLCIISAVLLAIVFTALTIYQAAVVIPGTARATEQALKEQKVPVSPGMLHAVQYATVIVQALFMVGYPLLAIALLMTPSVRKTFSTSRQTEDGDYDDLGRGGDDDRRDYDDRRRDDYDDR